MHSLGIIFIVASVSSPLGTVPPAVTQEAASEPTNEVKQKFLLWQRRKEFAELIRDNDNKDKWVQARVDDHEKKQKPKGGNRFKLENIKNQLKTLSDTEPNLEAWKPTESEQLEAMTTAFGEFMQVLSEARDKAVGNMTNGQNNQTQRGNQPLPPKPRPPAPYSPSDTTVQRLFKIADHARYESEMAKWRGEVASRARVPSKVAGIDKNKADLEAAFRKTSDETIKKFDEACDRFLPPIVADGHVAQYREKKLIEGFKRLEVPTQTNINLSDCRDKARIREVVYDVTDGFGVKRRGSVAVYLADPRTHDWKPSRDNDTHGGFYELHLAPTDQ